MLNSDDLYPWPLGIMVYQGEYSSNGTDPGVRHADDPARPSSCFCSPQKHIVAGLTAGAVKAELSHQPNSNGSKRSLHEKSRHRRHRLRRHQQAYLTAMKQFSNIELRAVADMRSAAASSAQRIRRSRMRVDQCATRLTFEIVVT